MVQRLGRVPKFLRQQDPPEIWVHAVSLGEVIAVLPLVKALRDRYPHWSILVSTITETGREAVEQRLVGVAQHCYLPLDFPWSVEMYVRQLRPRIFIFVETELWPNLLKCFHRHQIPTVLVNGRLSTRSYQRYQWIQVLMAKVLSTISLCLMQSECDASRIKELGAVPQRVYRTGNMKFDLDGDDSIPPLPEIFPDSLGLDESEVLIIGGSTHSEEEDFLLGSYHAMCRENPCTVLLLAPRHIERVEQVEEKIRAKGFKAVRRSRLKSEGNQGTSGPSGPRVIILDSRGELAGLYALARVAFVGGTLAPIGGHNLLEPAKMGKPVFFGPYTDHCEEVANLLIEAEGGIQVQDGMELTTQLLRAIRDPAWVDQMGKAALEVVHNNQGVVERNLELIEPLLKGQVMPRLENSTAPSKCLQEHQL
jgi:3-deoxy-D-manno-octulosonic-acid transferase